MNPRQYAADMVESLLRSLEKIMTYTKKVLSEAHKRNIARALRGRKRPERAGRPAYDRDSILKMVDIRKPNECWPWKGWTNAGYGRLEILDKTYYAHRVVFELHNPGAIAWAAPRKRSESGWLLHSCDNPICCNPSHLSVGTHAENMADMRDKGRSHRYTSTASPRAKLTAEDVFWIRMQKKYGATKNALALLYDVSVATISGCLYGRHYKDVPNAEMVITAIPANSNTGPPHARR